MRVYTLQQLPDAVYRARSVFAVVRGAMTARQRSVGAGTVRDRCESERPPPIQLCPNVIKIDNYIDSMVRCVYNAWWARVGLAGYSPRVYNFLLRNFHYTMMMI